MSGAVWLVSPIDYVSPVGTTANPLVVQASTSAPSAMQGNAASGATDTGNPVKVGGKYNSTLPTFVDGQRGDLQLDSRGNTRVTISDANGSNAVAVASPANATTLAASLKTIAFPVLYNGTTADLATGDTNGMVVQHWATNGNRWNYAAATSGIVNTTTAVTIKTAGGASIRNYLNSIQVQTATLGGATELAIRDGAAGTVLWRSQLQTTALPLTTIVFDPPLRGTANTLMEVVTLTAVTGGVYVNGQGFMGA